MVERKKKALEKRGRSVPVKITISAPSVTGILPPLPIDALQPQLPKQPISPSAPRTPAKILKQPVHEWSEAKRRRLMWWLVGGGAIVIIIGWLAVVRLEMNGGSGKNLFSEAWQLIRSVNLGSSAKTTATEKEIRQLDKEVFPQFSQ